MSETPKLFAVQTQHAVRAYRQPTAGQEIIVNYFLLNLFPDDLQKKTTVCYLHNRA